MEKNQKLISFNEIDPRLAEFRTGDIALTSLDNISGMFIFAFTQSLVEHSAIACWVDRKIFENLGRVEFVSNSGLDNILMFVHITKRKMYDYYSRSMKNGLVLCSLDEYCGKNLTTIWTRKLNRLIPDNVALKAFSIYLSENSGLLEYENDIRTILGLPFNIKFRPYEHRMVCTTMVCDYLNKSYGYPFLISVDGHITEGERDLETREINFIITEREFDVYRAVDFCYKYNKSPVFEDEEEKVTYGKTYDKDFILFHPIYVMFMIVLFILILLVCSCYVLFKFCKSANKHG